jgi:signal transduction histidine kinase
METPQMPVFIRTGAARLRQVLLNLANNAVKFTEQGSVTLRVNAVPSGESGKLRVTFEIEDTGKALPPRIRLRSSTPLCRRTPQSATKALGLTISRQIIELMGGK